MRAEDVTPEGTTAIVVPCYNEAERLRPDLFLEALTTYPWMKLLLVDDGSRDSTRVVLDDLAARSGGQAEVIALARNGGKAEAVRQGMLRALSTGASYAGYWDADLATPFEALPAFLSVMRQNPAIEIVMGSRVQLLGRNIERTAARHYVGRVFATGASIVLRLPVYDTQCGAKVFRANDRVRQLFSAPFQTRWIFDVELLARYLDSQPPDPAAEPGLAGRIYELPLCTWNDAPGSKVRAKDGLRAIADLFRIYWLRTRR